MGGAAPARPSHGGRDARVSAHGAGAARLATRPRRRAPAAVRPRAARADDRGGRVRGVQARCASLPHGQHSPALLGLGDRHRDAARDARRHARVRHESAGRGVRRFVGGGGEPGDRVARRAAGTSCRHPRAARVRWLDGEFRGARGRTERARGVRHSGARRAWRAEADGVRLDRNPFLRAQSRRAAGARP